MSKGIIITGIIIIISIFIFIRKDNFYNLQKQTQADYDINYRPQVFNGNITPALKNNETLTKTDIANLFKMISTYTNGPPSGANTTTDQNKYDLLFKDILVDSDKRNQDLYPNPHKYTVTLNLNIDKIYKAELIEVYIPAATDDSVNIPVWANRLYFTYNYTNPTTSILQTTTGYIIIQAGTYMSPASIADELTRQFNIVLQSAGFVLSKYVGVCVIYDKNLNRYIFKDKNFNISPTLLPTLTIYPDDGTNILTFTVTNSIAPLLMLNYDGPYIFPPYTSGPKTITNINGNLYVNVGTNYGQYIDPSGNVQPVQNNVDCLFSNCIISDVVLTDCKLYLSITQLNGTTCNLISDQRTYGIAQNVPNIFCQVPNNTCVSSASTKTLLNQPSNFSAIQFYNPVLSKLNKLDISWYSEDGELTRILDHCFTLRIYYFQKRIDTTDFSIQIPVPTP